MVFQKFHSPALGGFAVISHWLPFLLFSVYSGALADRFDPRRIIQIGMVLFMLCSLAWGVLFVTGTLQLWHAVVHLHRARLRRRVVGTAVADAASMTSSAATQLPQRRAADGDVARSRPARRARGRRRHAARLRAGRTASSSTR